MDEEIIKYISNFPKDIQNVLREIRSVIQSIAPQATEKISYGIPTFVLNGKNLVHFAAFKNHYSFFPTSSGVEHFKKDLKKYKISKGTIQFPVDEEIPYALIEKITKFRVKEITKDEN